MPACFNKVLLFLMSPRQSVLSLALMLMVFMVFGSECVSSAAAETTPASALLTVTQARVSHDGGKVWIDVVLPDHWPQRGAVDKGRALYELRFDLASQPAEGWALAFSHISTYRRVSVNDQLLSQRADGSGYTNRRALGPALIDLPPSLLRAGDNVILIEVQHYVNGMLSAAVLGRVDDVRGHVAVDNFTRVDLPKALNLASMGLALFMLTVWLRRRSEIELGSFAGLALVTGWRNLAYFSEMIVVPPMLLDWFFYSSQVATAVLLGVFARANAGDTSRWYGRLLLYAAIVLPAVAAVLAGIDGLNHTQRLASGNASSYMTELRRWSYPLLAMTALCALALLIRATWRSDRSRNAGHRNLPLMALGVGALLIGGVHDYFLLMGRPLLVTAYLLPYLFPVVLGSVSVYLVARMVAATGAAEALAAELDQRVVLRTQQLSEANAVRTRFLSAASHDLRQPALTIGLLVSLLRDGTEAAGRAADDQRRRLLDKLHAAAGSLERLLNGLLDLSRLDPLLVKVHSQTLALQPMLTAIAHDVQADADAKGLGMRWRTTALAVHADPVLLEQILRNLVGNALRYTAKGGVLVAARRLQSGGVRLQVCDTGIGIAAGEQQRVFEEFVQLGNPGRNRLLGQGLGLAIAQRSAQAMGARVMLRSVPGRGSSFSIDLPGVNDVATDVASVLVPAVGAKPLLNSSIWLLDDDDALRDAMTLRLQAWGAEVQAFSSLGDLRKALNDAKGGSGARPAVLLTDQRMPDGSGEMAVDMARRALGAELPCLVLTGDPDAAETVQLRQQGVPVLTKPVALPELLRAIERVRC